MKKRLLALVLALVVALGLVACGNNTETPESTPAPDTTPTLPPKPAVEAKVDNACYEAAKKMTADGVFAAGGTVNAKCPYCETEAEWEAFPAITSNEAQVVLENKHYYLAEDVDYTQNKHRYNIGRDENNEGIQVCVHLNGQNLSQAEDAADGRVFWVDAKGYLTIMGEGTITAFGKGTTPEDFRGSAIDTSGGTINLCGGTYKSTSIAPIVFTRSKNKCNIRIYEGTNIQGEPDCTVPRVYLNAVTNISVCGGVIDGGIFTNAEGSVTVSNNAKITKTNGGLDLTSGILLTLATLEETAEIYVTANDGVFSAAEYEKANYADWYVDNFKPAADGKKITVEAKQLVIG